MRIIEFDPETENLSEENKESLAVLKLVLSKNLSTVHAIYGDSHEDKLNFLAKAIPAGRPCLSLHAFELFDECSDKMLKQNIVKLFRFANRLVFKETKKIVVGEVLSISAEKITLKTKDMESEFTIGANIRKEIIRERVFVGDIIKIYKESGYVVKVGRVSSLTGINNNSNEVYDLPEGECFKSEDVSTILTLDELDVVNCKLGGENLLYSSIVPSERIRLEVNNKVIKWLKEGKAEFFRGIVTISGAEYLDVNQINYLLDLLNDNFVPSIIFIFDTEYKENVAYTFTHNFMTNYSIEAYCLKNKLVISAETKEFLMSLDQRNINVFKLIRMSSLNNEINLEKVMKVHDLFDFRQ